MAEQQTETDQSDRINESANIQQIVAAVISNLHALPSPNRSSNNSFNNSPSSRPFQSSQQELRKCFCHTSKRGGFRNYCNYVNTNR